MESQSVMWYKGGNPSPSPFSTSLSLTSINWRPKNLRNFLRDFHFSFMSYCWRSWPTISAVSLSVWVCDIIRKRERGEKGDCSGDFWTHKSSVRKVKTVCLLCLRLRLRLSCCFCLFSFFGDPISSGKWPLCVYLLLCPGRLPLPLLLLQLQLLA